VPSGVGGTVWCRLGPCRLSFLGRTGWRLGPAAGAADPDGQELVGGRLLGGGQGPLGVQALEAELQITLGDSWSFRQPAAVGCLSMAQQLDAAQAGVPPGNASGTAAADFASRSAWLAGSLGQQQQQHLLYTGSCDTGLGLLQSCQQRQQQQQQHPAGGGTLEVAETPDVEVEDGALLFLQ